MKILYCTADKIGTPTGGGAVTANELRALQSIGDVVALSGDELNCSGFRQQDSVFLADYFALSLIKDMKFDLAHFYSGTFSHTVAWLKAHGTKVTYTVPAHDRRVTVEEFERFGYKYPYPHIKDDDLWRFFSQGYRDADVVIVPSELSAGFMRLEGCKNVTVIPHGCNPVNTTTSFPSEFAVGSLGQLLGPDKGILYLLKAWEMLNYKDASLMLAGTDRNDLAKFVQSNTARGKYKLKGWLPDVSEMYGNITIFCQPSVVESFGIEVLESFSHGKPVIVSEGAGVSELVSNGGIKVPIRSPEKIAEAIDWFKNHPVETVKRGEIGKGIADEWRWDNVRNRYIDLWNMPILLTPNYHYYGNQ